MLAQPWASGSQSPALTRMQYSLPASVETAVTSVSSAVPSERKKLVWQSSWHVNTFSSVSTRQQGTHGVGATPWGITCVGWGRGVKPGTTESHLHGLPCGETLLAQDKAACSILTDIPAPFSSATGAQGKAATLGACPQLTPLETAWQKYCIQSAMSSSLSALSSREGRSVRITWKEWGRSVVLERRHPPHCSPLGERGRRDMSGMDGPARA